MFNRDMVKRTFAITLGIVAVLVISIIVVMVASPKEVADLETEPEVEVKASIIEEETTTNETQETVAVTDPNEPVTDVAPEETETEVPTYTVEELADYVLNAGLNGADREALLGERYEEVQAYIDATFVPQARSYAEDSYEAAYSYPSGSGVLTPDKGVNYYGGVLETYYNLDMSGVVEWMHSLGYSGDYWVRGDGVKMFGDYVMVAADYEWMPKGSIVETSLGTGIVCDTGLGGWYWFDIAVNW